MQHYYKQPENAIFFDKICAIPYFNKELKLDNIFSSTVEPIKLYQITCQNIKNNMYLQCNIDENGNECIKNINSNQKLPKILKYCTFIDASQKTPKLVKNGILLPNNATVEFPDGSKKNYFQLFKNTAIILMPGQVIKIHQNGQIYEFAKIADKNALFTTIFSPSDLNSIEESFLPLLSLLDITKMDKTMITIITSLLLTIALLIFTCTQHCTCNKFTLQRQTTLNSRPKYLKNLDSYLRESRHTK